jgi:hypothetical protein
MGALAGASDLLLWHRGNSFALELKSPGGRPSDAQLDFLARFNDAGGHSASAEGVNRALDVLESWGLLRGRASPPPHRCPTEMRDIMVSNNEAVRNSASTRRKANAGNN